MKRVVIGLLLVFVVAGIGLALLARSVLTGDNVRAAIAAQLSRALGQPVAIGGLTASAYPRVTVDLTDVRIGEPARLQFASMHLATGLRALFSRRIEGGEIQVDGARITLPLPPLRSAGTSAADSSESASPLQIVSIDQILLRDVEVVSGDRTLRGDIDVVPEGTGIRLRRVALTADETTLDMTGVLTSLAPVEGRVEATTGALDLDRLLAFLQDFTAASAPAPGPGPQPPAALSTTGIDGRLTLVLTAGRATTGQLVLSDLAATAVVLPGSVTFEPLTFDVFGGHYEGTMHVALGASPRFRWNARVSRIDTASLMAYAGTAGAITGTLSGTTSLEGSGLEMDGALRTANGKARVDITDGTIAGLSLVRTIVTAGSGRGGWLASAGTTLSHQGDPETSERFSRLGATLAIADGRMTTSDFSMSSPDVDLRASGTLSILTMNTNFSGQVQLSEALTKQAGTDLVRYTQEQGRVTLPVSVTGPLGRLTVRVDIADAAKRAIRNRAEDEVRKALERNMPKGLRGLLRKKGGGGPP